jgi:glycosyltransferase involved in cell wall biosynthesis
MTAERHAAPKIMLSIGILAWNEEEAIGAALESLFAQTLFAHLAARDARCEILCVTNGCTDRTASVAAAMCELESATHPHRGSFSARVCDIQQRGKNNAWNLFVHQLSRKEADYLFLMDGDIVLQDPDTLWNMWRALEINHDAAIATDSPIKDISLKKRKGLCDCASLAASEMTQSAPAQVTGQLYCIRSRAARNIFLPRDLVACEDGFIKSLVCTDFLTRESTPGRVVQAESASHVFQAYTSPPDLLRNRKRQIIGQTIVHFLIDKFLKRLPPEEKLNLADTIRSREQSEPAWLRSLIAEHLRQTRLFWRLYPNLLSSRFARLRQARKRNVLLRVPVALADSAVTFLGAWLARRFLVKGYTDYWPDTRSPGLRELNSFGDKPRQTVMGRVTAN